ncbi:phosphoribosyltransferase [Chamaesiphon sp. VAR_69_metabat_338]|uniref:phosphoribosyltransferase n=1 Tax=Chamaesiphon sp. VAR_69_metabat_338 TaxID=2964704 RepID=UPI00286E1A31|nr:phosphoribosyltransferase [Chamaesiphon sp. VAR_69_metabat_338]
MNKKFRDRTDAGRQLALKLASYAAAECPQSILLGLPRGGVLVAAPIAQILQVPLDLCLVHKLGVPGNAEFAMGSIDLQGRRYLHEHTIADLRISPAQIDRVAEIELQELQRRDRAYRGDRPPLDVRDRVVILVDDGLATGATMKAAIAVVRSQNPAQIVVAVPVAFPDTIDELRPTVDAIVCLMLPTPFDAIGSWYENFAQTTDEEVCAALN